jgi:hypothetical protein
MVILIISVAIQLLQASGPPQLPPLSILRRSGLRCSIVRVVFDVAGKPA